MPSQIVLIFFAVFVAVANFNTQLISTFILESQKLLKRKNFYVEVHFFPKNLTAEQEWLNCISASTNVQSIVAPTGHVTEHQ